MAGLFKLNSDFRNFGGFRRCAQMVDLSFDDPNAIAKARAAAFTAPHLKDAGLAANVKWLRRCG